MHESRAELFQQLRDPSRSLCDSFLVHWLKPLFWMCAYRFPWVFQETPFLSFGYGAVRGSRSSTVIPTLNPLDAPWPLCIPGSQGELSLGSYIKLWFPVQTMQDTPDSAPNFRYASDSQVWLWDAQLWTSWLPFVNSDMHSVHQPAISYHDPCWALGYTGKWMRQAAFFSFSFLRVHCRNTQWPGMQINH